jgi:hypothetical protein
MSPLLRRVPLLGTQVWAEPIASPLWERWRSTTIHKNPCHLHFGRGGVPRLIHKIHAISTPRKVAFHDYTQKIHDISTLGKMAFHDSTQNPWHLHFGKGGVPRLYTKIHGISTLRKVAFMILPKSGVLTHYAVQSRDDIEKGGPHHPAVPPLRRPEVMPPIPATWRCGHWSARCSLHITPTPDPYLYTITHHRIREAVIGPPHISTRRTA